MQGWRTHCQAPSTAVLAGSWQSGVWSEPQSHLVCPGHEVGHRPADDASSSKQGEEREADDDDSFYLS